MFVYRKTNKIRATEIVTSKCLCPFAEPDSTEATAWVFGVHTDDFILKLVTCLFKQ